MKQSSSNSFRSHSVKQKTAANLWFQKGLRFLTNHKAKPLVTAAFFTVVSIAANSGLALAQDGILKQPDELITDAYTSILNRNANQAERQFWTLRLKNPTPDNIIDLYDGLTRLPEYRKRFAGLAPKDQIQLLKKTLFRMNPCGDESSWLTKLQKNGLTDTTESMVESMDHTMSVYLVAGVISKQENELMHLAANTPKKAETIYKEMIYKHTHIPQTYYNLSLQQASNTRLSAQTLQQALDKFPDNCRCEFQLALLLNSLNMQTAAFVHNTKALHRSDEKIGADSLIPDMKTRLDSAKHPELLGRELLLSRALAHKIQDHHDYSIPELDRALAFGAGDGRAYSLRCDSYYQVGQYAKSLADANAMEKIYGANNLGVAWTRGMDYMHLGQYQKAIPDLTTALKQIRWDWLYAARAKCYGALGKRKEQIADLTSQIELLPKSAKARVSRGRAYLEIGRYKEALADANAAIKLSSRYREGYRLRIDCFRKLKDKAGADADQKTLDRLDKEMEDFKF